MHEGLKAMTVVRRKSDLPLVLRFVLGVVVFAGAVGFENASAQQLASRDDQQKQSSLLKSKHGSAMAAVSPTSQPTAPDTKPVRGIAAKGPYYVDFRARTAASYGHAFVWFGKTTDKEVEVAGLHPKGDILPYIIGHLILVPAETGPSYGDLDEQYLTASYRVYLSEADAEKVFAYIRHLQSTLTVWHVETVSCTFFISRIANFMGLKTPIHLFKTPEAFVNELKDMNDGRQTVQLDPKQDF
jgi:hypothetical protein